MSPFTLTMLDTTGIQDYVFRSNRLQENIGASEIVYRVTTQWAIQALDDEHLRANVHITDRENGQWEYTNTSGIEADDSIDAEVVYAGGGNTFIVFRAEKAAIAFTKRLTRRVLAEAPGLGLVVRHRPFDWDAEPLWMAQTESLRKLATHKLARPLSAPLLGLAVTEPCDSTGLAAVRTDETSVRVEDKWRPLRVGDQAQEPPRSISRETLYKLGWRDLGNARLMYEVGDKVKDVFEFPADIDRLGRARGEESFVAVVHADGNGMGQHVKRVSDGLHSNAPRSANREYVKRLRAFSEAVNKASLAALKRVVDQVTASLSRNDDGSYEIQREWGEPIPIVEDYLPFRPLVFGGDDVTLLAAGQLGLSVAAAYLQAFEEETSKDPALPAMYASAGVAIVKSHYPFSRAYALSEELTHSAKKLVRDQAEGDQSALDWHFALTGLFGDLGSIRKREYGKSSLLMRPLRLRATEMQQDGRYWFDGLERVVRELQSGPAWRARRNKVKGLMEALRGGGRVAEAYRRTYDLPLLPALVPGDPGAQVKGWTTGDTCAYFDALELLDHYVPLRLLEVA